MGNGPSDAQEELPEVDLHVRRDLNSNSTGSRDPHSGEQTHSRANAGSSSRLASSTYGGAADAAAKQEAAAANALGVDLLRQQQQSEAVRQFKIALSHEPGSVQILNNIGLAYAKMQDFTSAYEWYEKAYKQDVSDVETLFSLAWVERKRQRHSHAKELFQRVLDMDPEHVKALYLLGDILKTAHDYDGAAKYFERLVRMDPNSVDGHISLAHCYEHAKQYSRAAQMYRLALNKVPGRTDVVYFLGRVYYLAKQYREAIAYFERIPDSDARALDARIYGAKVFRELDDHEQAIACAEQAARLRPHGSASPDIMHFLGEEYSRVGDQRLAAHWFGRALDLDNNHASSLLEMGQLMYRQSRWPEAESHLSRLIEQDRSNSTALRVMALVKYKQNKLDSCRRYCEATLKLDQVNPDVLWILAEMHKLEGSEDEKWFLHLRHTEAPAADICQAIAKGYLTRKEVSECTHWLQKAQHYLPTDSPVRDALRLLARKGSAVEPRDIFDILDQKVSLRTSSAESPESLPKRDRQPRGRWTGAEERKPESHGGYAESRAALKPVERPIDMSRSADNTAEDLEWLLARAERASARPGSGLSSDARAAEQQWQEVLASAKSTLRKRPEDPLALRCAARALLSTGGDSAQIRDYARRAVANGDEATGFTLGYALHAYLGACHEREQDTAGAEKHYAAALSSKPGDETAMLGLARALLQRMETSRARQLYEQVSMSNSSCAESQLKLAEIALEAGDHPDAYRCASKASKLSPMDAAVLFCLGQACMKTARHEEAARALEQGLVLQPTNSSAMQMLAAAQRKMGRDQDAITWLKRLLEIRPGDYDCNLNLAQLYAGRQTAGASQAIHYFRSALRCRPSVTDKRDIYLQMANLQCSISTWKDARDTLEMAVREIPDDVDLWQKLLEVYEKQQDAHGQHKCYGRLVQLGGASNSSKVAYGEFLLSEGQLERAREQFQAVLQMDPTNTVALLKMASSWRQDPGGHLDEALKGFEQVLQVSPLNAEALEGSAYCHRKNNNLDEAMRLYQQCLKVKSTAEAPLYYLGDILYRQHRHAECQHYLGRLVETNCSAEFKTGALYILAKSHVSLDDYEEAERHARSGLAEKPDHPHFLFILALVQNRMAEYDSSVATLKQASQKCDSSDAQLRVDIHDWLAQAYERKQDYKAAMSELDVALQKDPSHASSLITRGLVHIQLKQLDQAEESFRRALAVEKNHALALVRLGYCKLLGSDHHEATNMFQRALQQRCGTVALPRSVKGSARIYMALSYTGQSDTDQALVQLSEARKSHRNFNAVCTKGKEVIVKGECDGLVQQLRGISDLHVNVSQAWQLVHLMAKELEFDLREPASAVPSTTSAASAAASKPGAIGSAAGTPYGSGTTSSAFGSKSGAAALAAPRIGALHGPAPGAVGSWAGASKAWTSPERSPPQAWRRTAADGPSVEPPASNGDRRKWTPSPDAAPQMSPTPSSQDRRQWTTSPGTPQRSPDRADRRSPGDAPPPESAAFAASNAERRKWSAPEPSAAPQERRQWTQDAAKAVPETPKASSIPAAGQKLNLDRQEQIDFSVLTTHECLGTGGFGAVYRGYFKEKEVAIKKLFCEDSGNISPLQLEELEKEVAALRGLDHPRLVAFIGACLNPPNLCIVTEYMPNGSLHHLLHKARTPLTLSTQAKIALQVCEGVAFLHGLIPPVIHRDLKSLNIVLDHSYNAKICDFGLTQSMENTHISLKDGGNGGSPRYMAPECYDCKGKITEKVDVWAMGCIIVESFGGPLPYDDCTHIQQIVAKVLIDKQTPYIPHHLPRGVRPIIEDCFHFNVKMRTTAQDVFSRLRKLHLAPAGN